MGGLLGTYEGAEHLSVAPVCCLARCHHNDDAHVVADYRGCTRQQTLWADSQGGQPTSARASPPGDGVPSRPQAQGAGVS